MGCLIKTFYEYFSKYHSSSLAVLPQQCINAYICFITGLNAGSFTHVTVAMYVKLKLDKNVKINFSCLVCITYVEKC